MLILGSSRLLAGLLLVLFSVLVLVLVPARARVALLALSCVTCKRLVSLQGPVPILLVPLGVEDDLAEEE